MPFFARLLSHQPLGSSCIGSSALSSLLLIAKLAERSTVAYLNRALALGAALVLAVAYLLSLPHDSPKPIATAPAEHSSNMSTAQSLVRSSRPFSQSYGTPSLSPSPRLRPLRSAARRGTTPKFASWSTLTIPLSVQETPEGAGAMVRRSIGTSQLRNFTPFLMLDNVRSSSLLLVGLARLRPDADSFH